MKKAKTIIDTDKDMITFFNKRIIMISTESEHYLMEVQDWKREYDHEEIVESMVLLSNLDSMDTNNKWKVIKRMHHNLGHPGQRTFETMLKNSTFKDLDMKLINKLYESCKTCFKFRNSKPKCKGGPPMAQDFNYTACMDLRIWHGTRAIILYKVLVNDWIKF